MFKLRGRVEDRVADRVRDRVSHNPQQLLSHSQMATQSSQ